MAPMQKGGGIRVGASNSWRKLLVLSKGMDPWRVLRAPLLFPWETGFFQEVMTGGERPLRDEADLTEAAENVSTLQDGLGQDRKRRMEGRVEEQEEELVPTELAWDPEEAERLQDSLELDERLSLVNEFARWVRTSSVNCDLQRQMLGEADEDKQVKMVDDALVERSTGTLRVRIGSLRVLGRTLGKNPLECTEENLYQELCRLRDVGSPHSRAVGHLQALRFGVVVCGSASASGILGSRRLVGAAYGPQQGRFKTQRSALTLRQLVALEEYVSSVASAHEAALGGHLLFCVYAQARWGDTQHLVAAPKLDVQGDGPGVIEGLAKKSKGVRGLKRLRMQTPVLALAYSVSGRRWWQNWVDARSTLRLGGSPALPCYKADGALGNKPMASSYAANWLKGTLAKLGVDKVGGEEIGSHSCRATLQSWLSRWGMAPSARRALAHHLKPGDRMGVVYSRDHLVGPLGGVVRMIDAIKAKQWDPDNVRSLLLRASLGKKDYGGMTEKEDRQQSAAASSSGFPLGGQGVAGEHEPRGIEVGGLGDEPGVAADLTIDGLEETEVEEVVHSSNSEDGSSTSEELSDEHEYELADDLSLERDDEGGPYLNPRSGFVHDVEAGHRNTRCGLVLVGYTKLTDLSQGNADGTGFCKKCYRELA